MKYIIPGTIIGIAALVASTGVALAEDGGHGQDGLGVSGGAQVGLNLGLHGDAGENENASSSADVEVGEHSTTTPSTHGEKKGLLRHFGTTTPPGIARHGDEGKGEATSTDKGGKGGGVPAFLRWLFGLPATTTIGDIQAQIGATTTASTTSPSQGLGFFAHLFGFFHFGKSD